MKPEFGILARWNLNRWVDLTNSLDVGERGLREGTMENLISHPLLLSWLPQNGRGVGMGMGLDHVFVSSLKGVGLAQNGEMVKNG